MPSTVKLCSRRHGPLLIARSIDTTPCGHFAAETKKCHISHTGFVVYLGRRKVLKWRRRVPS